MVPYCADDVIWSQSLRRLIELWRRSIDLMHTYPPDSVSSRARLSSEGEVLP